MLSFCRGNYMKSIFKKLAIPLCFTLLTACTPPQKQSKPSSEIPPKEYSELLPYDHFDLDTYMQPIWLGDTMYNETIMFVGKDDLGKLLYPVDEIIAVTSYDLETVYEEGVDYTFDKATNSILRTQNSSMPLFYKQEYYPVTGQFHSYTNGQGLFFSETDAMSKRHIAVTYRATKDKRLTAPIDYSSRYENLIAKLQSGKNVKICFYGDSITVGANGSGFMNIDPYMPSFDRLVTKSLMQVYDNPNITFSNRAKGGENTLWGYENVSTVIADNPDLIVLCWGMNDLGISSQKFKTQLTWIIDEIQAASPSAAILLVSSMLPNCDIAEWNLRNDFENCKLVTHEQMQAELAETYGLGLARVTTMHKEILRYKPYYTMSGNNVNHPTDFLIRVYAQNILYALTGQTL